jgi:protein ImuB
VLDETGRTVRVDARLTMSAPPATVCWSDAADQPTLPGFDRAQPTLPGFERPQPAATPRPGAGQAGGPAPGCVALAALGPGPHRLVAWAGPWPMVERWWSATPRRRVHLQVALEGGPALLLSCSQGRWTCEAVYD